MELSIEEQLMLLQDMSDEEVALLPRHLAELYDRLRQAEATMAVGGYYEEPEDGSLEGLIKTSASKNKKTIKKKK